MPPTTTCLSLTSNFHSLTEKFRKNADLKPTSNMELRADPNVKVQTGNGSGLYFITTAGLT